MAQIISATRTRSFGREGGKRARFLFQARELLDSARGYAAHGRFDQALEVAYQAALRTAGARVAASAVARRRRLPSSAWERLALVGVEDKRWAETFKAYSRTRARVASGLDEVPGEKFVYGLMQRSAQFLDESEAETTFGSFAA
ncbi:MULTISPECIES: SAV_6107 family HEPN domain-containing protein [Corynebacterium]|uniref:SAV_6107 family HEPN domain-containing protein n=1 Tax=Corynebacterium tuberculostearicum TaxID=38304 RepID=A0AAE4NLL7_9CORY|nr:MULTISPECIES: SAV_6107 family HEPN domain-containing protein [Corynebacterium]MCG7440621.1 SAV_6107 family HEPN domain-containing protein [Corynebacterium sp. ACRPQ]MCG7464495.1 SAV_6107 family HEPN domain-containing protein [Corynebacterium sp. ACRPJ]MCT1427266.1 SAV_6107 family HEPN domain-containing protein [Corynebacterium sp. p3-SID1241]MDV2419115.1 SAV_6107 family HEPN domain-containing protein [Corynebacterium tuberculostearicum]MDV2432102.1 SAV_6107 family HEPN domain-containing pro